MTVRKTTTFLGITLLLIAVVAFSFRDQLIYIGIKHSLAQAMIAPPSDPESFELHFCGTGTPRFAADRSQPCLVVIAGEQTLLFDAGQGALWAMEAMHSPWMSLDAIFLTHLHSDHISGVGEVIQNGWVAGRRQPVNVFGPSGTEGVIAGFREVYKPDIAERSSTFGLDKAEADQQLWGAVEEIDIDDKEIHTVYNRDGVLVKAFQVEHPHWDQAYGYRIEYRGKTIVISGDTRASEQITRHAASADILVHEAYNRQMMTMAARAAGELALSTSPEVIDKIASVHTETHALADIAERAKVDKLIITHLIPPIPPSLPAEAYFVEGMSERYNGKIVVARDGMRVELQR